MTHGEYQKMGNPLALTLDLKKAPGILTRRRPLLRAALLVLASLPLTGLSAWGQQSGSFDDRETYFELMPYLVVAGMGGDLTVLGRTASFSQSAGDVLSNLQFGFMGRTRVTHKRWFVALDGVYMGLGAANPLVDAGVDQVIVEPSAGYRVAPLFEVLGGARYNSLSVEANFRGPLQTRLSSSKNWWDPFVGGRVILPLGERYSISVRLDIGGFGAGSRIAVNSEPLFNVKLGRRATLHAGWKFLYTDYEDNGGQFRYDVLTSGPLLGASFRW
jgi:hypothetical protein